MKLSVLVPYKPDFGQRDVLWEFVRKRYEEYAPHLELCIGEDNSPAFNRSRAVNKAAELASGDVFIIADSDVFFDFTLIGLIEEHISQREYLIPFTRGVRLTRSATQRILSSKGEEIGTTREDIESILNIPGALMNVVTRRGFEKIGALDERFTGWGYEDFAYIESLNMFYGPPHRIPFTIYHLWHMHASMSNDYDFNLHAGLNFSLYQHYRRANTPEKMERLISERLPGHR